MQRLRFNAALHAVRAAADSVRAGLTGVALACLALPLAARADDFTWNGGNGTWPSAGWTNVTTSATPVSGPTTGGNTATISAGTVTFAGNDTFGSDGTASSPTITLGANATLNSGGFFNTIWNLNLAGGTLLSDGGANANFPAYQLVGTLSVTGSQASTIAVAASPRNVNNAISVGGAGNATLTLDVGDVTGDADADLTIAAVLKNRGSSTVGNLTKTGSGTAVLSAINTYTGLTNVSGGTLSIASTGGLASAGSMNVTNGGRLSISGAVTLATNTLFGVGNGIAGTTGTTVIESGANVNLGGNAVLIGGGRPSLGNGAGSLVINGGTVTVAAASGTGGGADNNAVWLNPYGNGGASSLSLNGGVFATARSIRDGSAGGSTVNFNGGTLRLLATTTDTVNPSNALILAGGFVLDSNGFDASISRALLTDTVSTGGGLTKQGAGRLTLSGANTFTGATTISGGALRITNATGLGTTAAGTTVADGAALELSGTITVGAEPLSLTGAGAASGGALRNVANNNTFGGLISLAGPTRINSDSSTLTLSNTGEITGPGFDLSLGGAGSISLASIIGTGTGGLLKDGAGTATLSGASTFTGDVTVSGGTLTLNRASNTTTPTATALGNMNVARTVTIQSGATLTSTQHDPLGATSSSQPVTFIVDGGTLSHGNQFVTIGAIELRNGGLLTGGNGAVASYQSFNLNGNITVSGNAPASLTTTGTTNTASHLGRAGGVTFDVADVTGDGGVDFTVATGLLNRTPNVGGAGSLIKTGAGTMALTVANSYTGGTTITAGVLEAATGGLGPSGAVTMNGGTLRWGAGNTDDLSGRLTLVNSTAATLDTGGNNVSLASAFGGSTTAGLVKTGTGTLTLGGTNTFTGATTVSQGTLAVTGSINAASPVTVTSGGTLGGTGTAGDTTVATGGTVAPGVAGAGTLTISSLSFGAAPGDTATVAIGLASNIPASSVTVTGDVVANGSAGSVVFPFGTDLAFIPTGTYPLVSYGGTQLADVSAFAATGTVGARQGVAIGNGTGVINLVVSNAWPIWKGDAGSGWSTTDNWVLNTTSAPTSFIADDTVFFSDGADTGSVEITQNVNPTITTFNAASLAYTVSSSGGFGITSGSVVKSGVATVTIANANSYAGGTTLSAGTLRAGSDTAFGTGPVTVSAAGTTLGASANATLSNSVSLASNLTIDSGTHALGLAGGISGAGGIAKNGPGTLTLSAANTFTGANTVTAGTLALAGSGTLGGGTAALSLAGGRLDLGGTSQSAGAVTISAAAAAGDTITAGTLTGTSYEVSNSTGNVAIAAALAGSGSLTKTGAGTLTLSGATSFSGGTTISAGTLALSGGSNPLSSTGAITVSGGATLDLAGGSQATSGAVTLTGGTLAGGTLTLTSGNNYNPNGTITLGAGGAFRYDSAAQRLILQSSTLTMNGSAGGTMRFGGDASGVANYVGVDGQSGTLTLNGGTLAFVVADGQTNAGGGWLRIGANNGATGTVTVNSGLLEVGHSASLGARFDNVASAATSSGTLTISGGQVVVGSGTLTTTAGGANGYLYLKNDVAGSSGSAIVNLNGGTLTAKRIVPGTGGGTKALNLSGGTLRAGGSDASFLAAASGFTASIGDGGGTIDTNGFDIAISAPLAAAGSGGLTKLGTGSLTLSAANSFTGNTTITAGTLVAANAAALGTTGTVAIGAAGALGIADGVAFSRPLSLATGGRVRLGDASTVALPDAAALAAVESRSPEALGTLARLLYGSGSTQPTALSTAWGANPGEFFSDILTLDGTGAGNTFVLALAYDPAAPDLSLLNIGTRPGTTGAFAALGTSFVGNVAWNGSFTTPGQYGVDTTAGTVWAVTNHNSDFTVIAVPEPGLTAVAIAALAAGMGLAARRRRQPA